MNEAPRNCGVDRISAGRAELHNTVGGSGHLHVVLLCKLGLKILGKLSVHLQHVGFGQAQMAPWSLARGILLRAAAPHLLVKDTGHGARWAPRALSATNSSLLRE